MISSRSIQQRNCHVTRKVIGHASSPAPPTLWHVFGGAYLYPYAILSMENYQILGRIGEGAHGIVLKAKHIKVRKLHTCVSGPSTQTGT